MLLQSLEKRLLFVATPASPRADTLGSVFDTGERQALLDRLTHLDSGTKSTLQAKLNTSVGQFDSALLSYFRNRSNAHFYFDPGDAASIGSFISSNISFSDTKSRGDAVADSHLFPDQSSAGTFTVDLPSNIDWADTSYSTNPEFIHALNRQAFWVELSWAAEIDGNPKYATELEYELASWSKQFQTVGAPSSFSATDQQGWLLDSSIRAESWTFAYFTLLDDANFTAAEDSLFAYKILQQADFLYSNALTTTDYGSNRTLTLAKGLLYFGEMFPEMDNAAKWESTARNLLFKCMDGQLYKDGSHVEQSPGYTSNAAEDLLEARRLDELNGNTWPPQYKTQLSNAIDSYWQLLSPDGVRPAIGDTYRSTSFTLFLRANLIQGTNRWPAAKPRVRDAWLFGSATVTPYLSNAVTPNTLGTRGHTYTMQNSGNYVMRSDDTNTANQIIFDAGPKGGVHGHYDLLNFELWGDGRPLISDPGAYKYDSSADRQYVISTKAHNTINVDGANIGALEGNADGANGSIFLSQWDTDANHAQITASHWGYQYLKGQPVVTRSMWYDLDGTILIVDWGDATTSHTFQQSFNLQTEGDTNNITADTANFTIRTRYASGGNVKIQGLSRPGQTAAKGGLTFVTNGATGDYKDDAYRFTVTQSGSFVCFVTLISAYDGITPPNTTASLLNTPALGGTVQVQLTTNGVSQEVDFFPPNQAHLDSVATSRGTYNDVAFDKSNNLHLAYFDRDTRELMYAVRDGGNGKWSIPQVVDLPVSAGAGEYQFISLALDNNGHPGIAYFDGWDGDLRYAYFDPTYNSWRTTTIDSKGSTGLYPQLVFSRGNGAVISYYNRTKGDLDLAQAATGGYTITAIDSGGDVGRFSSITLDPNRPTATKWAIGYEDTTNGNYKYAIQGLFNGGTQINGYTNYTVDDLAIGGGYVSLAFYDSGTSDSKRYKPAMSYYDAANSALRYAKGLDSGLSWQTQTVASKNIQGLYTSLFFDSSGKANIFYFNRTSNEAIRAVLSGSSWSFTTLGAGGREGHVSLSAGGAIAYSGLDEGVGKLTVQIL